MPEESNPEEPIVLDCAAARFDITAPHYPLLVTAVHASSDMTKSMRKRIKVKPKDRLVEEDPFTDRMIARFKNRVVAKLSRWELDLNRSLTSCVYMTPSMSWGIEAYDALPWDAIKPSWDAHREYYANLESILGDWVARHRLAILLDVHTYNYRREHDFGSTWDSPKPEINLGVAGVNVDDAKVGVALSKMADAMSKTPINDGRRPRIMIDYPFAGGYQVRHISTLFYPNVIPIAVEFKKFFMDEKTGKADDELLDACDKMLHAGIAAFVSALSRSEQDDKAKNKKKETKGR